jgi:4,5-DOPA dioxygenase extradiol
MIEKELRSLFLSRQSTELMPVLFVGHGTPMNAIEENEFVLKWRELGKSIPPPKAVLCISAHWETGGTFVTAMAMPQTIHDFGGFPQELYEVQYPAPGCPELAYDVKRIIKAADVGLDQKWGLDHGSWSVIRNIYPRHEIPIVEMSLDWHLTPGNHYKLAKELAPLRKRGVLIIGSGNIVHNLRMIAWDHANEPEYGYDWAIDANETFRHLILENNHQDLINYKNLGTEVQLAVPTPDHYLPLLYSLAVMDEEESVEFFNDKTVMGSLSMTSIKIG